MASTTVASSSFRPLCAGGARPRSRNPIRKPSTHQNPNPNPKPKSKSNLKTQIGSEATSYTRLPPKHDEEEFSSSISAALSSSVIRLSESVAAARILPKNPIFEGDEEALGFDSDAEEEEEDLGFEWEGDEVVLGLGSDSSDEASVSDAEIITEEIDVGEVKEKGVPAVMRCFDTAKIYVKAGDGGNGVVAFRREKYVPFGGPSGGDGGRGGNVYVEVDGSMNSLLPFRKSLHFRAGRGAHGLGKQMAGARGEDVVVKVAPGTVVRDAKAGEVLLELMNPGDRALLLRGGRGGKGNASFKSGMNKAPKIAENGEEGAEMYFLSLFNKPNLFS